MPTSRGFRHRRVRSPSPGVKCPGPSTRRISGVAAAVAFFLLLPAGLSGRSAVDARWNVLAHVPGAVDVGGRRPDGRVVVAGRDGFFLSRSTGTLVPFARGPGGYRPPRGEAYIAVAPTRRVPRARGARSGVATYTRSTRSIVRG